MRRSHYFLAPRKSRLVEAFKVTCVIFPLVGAVWAVIIAAIWALSLAL